MASGHEYRANRPNTWLLRPMLQSEDSSCQPGAVHTWPLADMPRQLGDVCFRMKDGLRRFHITAKARGCEPKVDAPVELTIETDPHSGKLRASSVRPI